MGDEIALLCSLFPASADKQKQVLELMSTLGRGYYRQPSANCTTWCYYTLFPPRSSRPMIGGLEIYTSKSALSAQLNNRDFQNYHETVKSEELYAKDEELVAYYFTAGFVARKDHALPFGRALISLTKFICDDKVVVLDIIKDFVPFVRDEEPFVLTYAVFERKKNPKELFLFVRYKDVAGMESHSKAPRHDEVVKRLLPHMENDFTKETTVWQEVEDSFVSTQAGGPTSSSKL